MRNPFHPGRDIEAVRSRLWLLSARLLPACTDVQRPAQKRFSPADAILQAMAKVWGGAAAGCAGGSGGPLAELVAPVAGALVAGRGGGSVCALRLNWGHGPNPARADRPGRPGRSVPASWEKNHPSTALRPFRARATPFPMSPPEPSPILFRASSDSKTPFGTPPQLLAKDSGNSDRLLVFPLLA